MIRAACLLCLVLVLMLALGGCTSMSPIERSEITWQALNVVDTGQTVTIARQPHDHFEDQTAWAIGAHPKERDVYVFMAAVAVVHVAVSAWLNYENDEHPGHGWAQAGAAWQLVTLGRKGYIVARNFHDGIKPWEGSKP